MLGECTCNPALLAMTYKLRDLGFMKVAGKRAKLACNDGMDKPMDLAGVCASNWTTGDLNSAPRCLTALLSSTKRYDLVSHDQARSQQGTCTWQLGTREVLDR